MMGKIASSKPGPFGDANLYKAAFILRAHPNGASVSASALSRLTGILPQVQNYLLKLHPIRLHYIGGAKVYWIVTS